MAMRLLRVVLLLGLALLPGSSERGGPTAESGGVDAKVWTQSGGVDAKVWTQFPPARMNPLPSSNRNVGNAAPLPVHNADSSSGKDAVFSVPSGNEEAGSLNAIAALSPDDIWVVGKTHELPSKALVVHWDGKEWNAVTTFSGRPLSADPVFNSPPEGFPQQGDSKLYDVAALSPSDVWTVGAYDVWVDAPTNSGMCCWVPQPLVAHWDGKTWKNVSTPKLISGDKAGTQNYMASLYGSRGSATLHAIAAVAANDVWIVGELIGGGPLALHWDGESWCAISVPSHYGLTSVAALSSRDVWAAGGDHVIHWDGTIWREVYKLSFSSASYSHGFHSITVLSPDDIWAVGDDSQMMDSGIPNVAYAVHWDGRVWTYMPLIGDPNFGEISHRLSGIFAVAPDDVWAVGEQGGTPLVMHWDGKEWTDNPCPDRGSSVGTGPLSDVVAFPHGVVWAVGRPRDLYWERTPLEAQGGIGYILKPGSGPCGRVEMGSSEGGGPAPVHPSTLGPPNPALPSRSFTPVP